MNSTITTNFTTLDSASFKGSFLNENVAGQERNDEISKISIHNFVANFNGLKTTSDDILIINLTHPYLSADLHATFDVNDPNKTLDTQSFTITKGTGNIEFMFEGPLDNPSPQNTIKRGRIELNKGLVIMNGSGAVLSNCNAKIKVDNTNLTIDTLNCTIANSTINMSGRAKNVLALIGDNPNGVELELNVFSPYLNIDHLISIISRKYPVKKRVKKSTNNSLTKNLKRIDALLTKGKINVNVKAGKLKYHSFEANNLVATMRIDENACELKQASLVHGKGSLQIQANVQEASGGKYNLKSSINMNNLDAEKIMRELNNFGMNAFTSKNIRGTLSLKSNVSLNLTSKGDFDMNSLTGNANLSIKNGELVDFGPIKNIEFFLFKNRNFRDIKFAEIKDELAFKKGEITINRMEINSSVLSLFVGGGVWTEIYRYQYTGSNE